MQKVETIPHDNHPKKCFHSSEHQTLSKFWISLLQVAISPDLSELVRQI